MDINLTIQACFWFNKGRVFLFRIIHLLSTTFSISKVFSFCIVKILSKNNLQLINILWRESYSYLIECVPFNSILLRLYCFQWAFKRWHLRYEASNTYSLIFKWFFQNVCFHEWILECVETNFLNIFYLCCTYFLQASISSDSKTIETDVIYIFIYIYIYIYIYLFISCNNC